MPKFFRHNRLINYQPLLKFLFRLGYWGLIIAIFLSIWLFKGFGDGFLEGIEIGLKTFQFLREKCKNITPDYNAPHTILNGIIGMENLTEHQLYNLLLGLAATAKTKFSHFDSHNLTDSLIDLEDFCFIEYDEKLLKLAESHKNLTRSEILDLIIERSCQLKKMEEKAA